MRAFNSCTKQESGGRLLQHWLTTVRDVSLPISWLSFSITPLIQLLNLFSKKKKKNEVHRASNLVFIAGGEWQWPSLLVSLFLTREELSPQSSAKPLPETSSHFTGQSWVSSLSLPLAEERLLDEFKPTMLHFLELGTLTLYGQNWDLVSKEKGVSWVYEKVMGKQSAVFVLFGGIGKWKGGPWSQCLSWPLLLKGCIKEEIGLSFVKSFKLDKDLKPDIVCGVVGVKPQDRLLLRK